MIQYLSNTLKIIARVFLRTFPKAKSLYSRLSYNILARTFSALDFTFMNLGYSNIDSGINNKSDEQLVSANYLSEQLYKYVAEGGVGEIKMF